MNVAIETVISVHHFRAIVVLRRFDMQSALEIIS
jgi:hypothetical protein